MTGVLDVLGLVITALERARVRYTIGGSFASSFAGEPRASLDADIVVEMDRDQVAPFVEALGTTFKLQHERDSPGVRRQGGFVRRILSARAAAARPPPSGDG